ncbi:hypothetical protein FBU30_007879 [Linnemannia zychae]|nr:hypothetical protein FBU30_007879 [Linnemannia zychae]
MRRASKSSDWKTIEKSFLLFVTRLASMTRTAHNVRIIHIQDWEGTQTMQELWKVLKKFDGLQSLSIQKSALQYLYDSNDGLEAMEPSWPELWDLSFQDCDRLLDLEGIQIWLSHLVNLNLSGCTNIKSFKPLLYDLYSSPCFTTSSPCILKSLSLNHTLVSNTDLYVLLKRSPELEELRLDQCYNLTVRALEIIGFGRQDPPNTLHGNFAQSTQGTEAGEGSVISPPTESMDSSLDSQLAPPFHLTFIDTQDHHNELSSSTSSQSLPVPITAGSDSPSATATASHSLYSGSFVPQLRKLSLRDCSDLTDQAIRLLVGCRRLEWLVIRGIRQVDEDTAEWLHSQGVPLRKLLSPLGRWRYWHD